MDQALPAVVALSDKLDALTQQVAYLTEQAQIAERDRQARAELMHDITPIVNDGFRLAVEQLEEVQEYVDLGDLLRFVKRLLRNGQHLDTLLDQLDSVMDLVQTVGPLTNEMFEKITDLLQQAEHKGYFAFAKGGLEIADNVVTSFTAADMRQMGDSVGPMLSMVKTVARPEVMGLMRDIATDVEAEVAKPVPTTSLFALLGQMRDPDVRRGLALTLRLLRVIGARTNGR